MLGVQPCEQHQLGVALRQHALARGQVQHRQGRTAAGALQLVCELLGCLQQRLGTGVDGPYLGRFCRSLPSQLGLQRAPGLQHLLQQVAKGSGRELALQKGQVVLYLRHGAGQALVRDLDRQAAQAQQVQHDQLLRQHAQLACTVHQLGKSGGLNDVP